MACALGFESNKEKLHKWYNLTSIQFLTLNHVKSNQTCYDWDLVMLNSEHPLIFLNIKKECIYMYNIK